MYSTIHERGLVLVIANMYNTTARLPVVNAHARRHYLVALLLLGQQSLLCVVEHALCARQLLAQQHQLSLALQPTHRQPRIIHLMQAYGV